MTSPVGLVANYILVIPLISNTALLWLIINKEEVTHRIKTITKFTMKFIIFIAVIAMALLTNKVNCHIEIEGIDEVISLLENISESSSMLLSEMTMAQVDNRNTMAMVGQGQSQMAATLAQVATVIESQSQQLRNIESDMNTVVSVFEKQQETLGNISGLLSVIADQPATMIEMQLPQIPTTTAIPEATTTIPVPPLVHDCSELMTLPDDYPSGIYTIRPREDFEFDAYCDMEEEGGGWTVFQRRFDGSTDFYRNWEDYKNGFGSLDGEFWMGLQRLNILTNSGKVCDLLVKLEDFNCPSMCGFNCSTSLLKFITTH